jgi:hypothetical protein
MRVLLISDPNISETEPEIESSNGVDNMAYSSAGEEDSEVGSEEDVDEECEEEGESESEEATDTILSSSSSPGSLSDLRLAIGASLKVVRKLDSKKKSPG